MGLKPLFPENNKDIEKNGEKEATTTENLEEMNIKELSSLLHNKAQEGLAAIEELKGTMEQIAAAAEESAGSAKESLNSVIQIKNSSHILENDTGFVVNAINDLQEILEIAHENINDAQMGMEKTSKSAHSIVTKGEKLFESGKKISEAVELITKLSKRISILALNAAIEAARAKGSGKSFTVMASEIREMASKSNVYASRIKEIVEDIQTNISNLKQNVAQVGNRISNASENSDSALSLIQEILTWMAEVVENIKETTKSVKKVVAEVEKLHQGSETIAKAAEKSADAVSAVTETIGNNLEIFSKVEELSEEIEEAIKLNKTLNLRENIDLINELIEKLRSSMEKAVKALEEIEQAAVISKGDAEKNAAVAKNCLTYIRETEELINKVFERMQNAMLKFKEIIEKVEKIKATSKENVLLLEERRKDISGIRATLNLLNGMIRKIELSIVQIAALSINGAVEAIRYGELGEGFSEVSKDIKLLASQSEEHLDKVFNTINEVVKEADSIFLEINNVIIYQNAEIEKLQKLEFELKRNERTLTQVLEKVKLFKKEIEENLSALEQAKISSDQISEAAQISLRNATESKEATQIIFNISKDLQNISQKLSSTYEG